MDATGALAATRQTLDTLKSVPGWLLLGFSVSLSMIWFWPPFILLLPQSAQSVLPLALLVSLLLTILKFVDQAGSRLLERRRVALERDRERLAGLYRPFIALFLTRHVTICSGSASPRLRHRLANAREELGAYRRPYTGVKRAWRALFDRQTSSSAEVEFGGEFPLLEIADLVRKNAQLASVELIRLVNRADRSRYEDPDLSLMTDAELALFTHIDREHRKLSRRAG
ncbi:hypothetical protein ACO34A_29055 (plasmid) [Rhizobium sp. ACO-34A]|nr:hypothetical protein [Rhizobium sp. ACO-34A]ATN37809.1 hypothetical protein ACO34A_29055 [Rhizobium sp. ACO-34A]